MNPSKFFKTIFDKIALASAENMGNILIFTSVGAWLASSGAQLIGIAKNKNYTKEQKKFMSRQELADAATNIGLYFVLTKSLVAFSSKLVSTGKLATRSIVDFMAQNNLLSQRGKTTLNLSRLSNFNGIRQPYTALKCFADSTAAVTGGIISSNIITPLVRDYYAAKRQQNSDKPAAPQSNGYTPIINTPRHTFEDFRRTSLGI